MDNRTSGGVHPQAACPHCGGVGELRYVYCNPCHRYVYGRPGTLSPIEDAQGLRAPIVAECGHEVFSLPGCDVCPDCGGTGQADARAA